MSLQTGRNRHGWVRIVTGGLACGALAAGVIGGFAVPAASADPADASAQADNPPAMTADEALAIIDRDYDIGEGGGQLSNLIHDVMKLRALGFKPSNANKEAITKALDYRPNQAPLIEALQDTLAYQHKMQALAQRANNGQQQPGYGFGIGAPPPGMGAPVPPGVPVDPGAGPGVGIFLPTG
ncbi:MAG TPA: hypothetical protein VFK56_04760 [Mycobacterium sp.]|nr:hypothetical protein [Mycobacterium sp.]